MNPERTPAPTTQPNNRLGRTAWMVMLVGLLTSSAMVGIASIAGARKGAQDLFPVLVMGLTIGFVSYFWALILACRAIRSGEDSRLPIRLFIIFVIPPILYGLWLFPRLFDSDWFYAWGLPIFVPLGFAFIILEVLVWKLMARLERASNLISRKRFLVKSAALTVAALLLGSQTLPVAFLMYDAFSGDVSRNGFGWMETTEGVCDNAERVLGLFSHDRWIAARHQVILKKKLSLSRLKQLCGDSSPDISRHALESVAEFDPEWAVKQALEILSSGPQHPEIAVRVLVSFGSDAERRHYLEDALNGMPFYAYEFFAYLENSRRDIQLIPLLKKVLKSQMPANEYALFPLYTWLPEKEFKTWLMDTWRTGNPNEHNAILYIVSPRFDFRSAPSDAAITQMYLRQKSAIAGIVLGSLLDHADLNTKTKALSDYSTYQQPVPMPERNVPRLIPLLSSDHPELRRAAEITLKKTIGIDSTTPRCGLGWASSHSGKSKPTGTLDAATETRVIKNLLEKAEAWMRAHPDPSEKTVAP